MPEISGSTIRVLLRNNSLVPDGWEDIWSDGQRQTERKPHRLNAWLLWLLVTSTYSQLQTLFWKGKGPHYHVVIQYLWFKSYW